MRTGQPAEIAGCSVSRRRIEDDRHPGGRSGAIFCLSGSGVERVTSHHEDTKSTKGTRRKARTDQLINRRVLRNDLRWMSRLANTILIQPFRFSLCPFVSAIPGVRKPLLFVMRSKGVLTEFTKSRADPLHLSESPINTQSSFCSSSCPLRVLRVFVVRSSQSLELVTSAPPWHPV